MRTPLGCGQNEAADDASTWLKKRYVRTVRRVIFGRYVMEAMLVWLVFCFFDSVPRRSDAVHPTQGHGKWFMVSNGFILSRFECHLWFEAVAKKKNRRIWGEWTMLFAHVDGDFKFRQTKSFDFLAIVTLWTRSLFEIRVEFVLPVKNARSFLGANPPDRYWEGGVWATKKIVGPKASGDITAMLSRSLEIQLLERFPGFLDDRYREFSGVRFSRYVPTSRTLGVSVKNWVLRGISGNAELSVTW